MKIKLRKKINKLWKDFQKVPEELKKKYSKSMLEPIGKYQYIYTSDKGEISMIKLQEDFFGKSWEICSYDTLFKDVMRFRYKYNAMQKIRELLG